MEGTMNIHMVYMTAGSREEARKIARVLVESRLAACVNIIDGMNAFYIWDNAIQDDTESVIFAKTTREKVPRLIETVKSMHSYTCPCIVSLPVEQGNPDFLDWVAGEVT